jgi:hypothetical protein
MENNKEIESNLKEIEENVPYDPSLEQNLDSDPEINEIFSEELEASPPIEEKIKESKNLKADTDDFSDLVPNTTASSSIFKKALESSKINEKRNIPSYIKDYLKLEEQENEEEEEEEEEKIEDTEQEEEYEEDQITGKESFSSSSGRSLKKSKLEDYDEDEDEGEDEEEDENEEEWEEDTRDALDQLQTEDWEEENLVNQELSRILGVEKKKTYSTSPGIVQNQSKVTPFSFFRNTASFDNLEGDGEEEDVDGRLISAESFSSGSFIEKFEDGFVFVDKNGQALAFIILNPPGSSPTDTLNPSDTSALFLIKSGEGGKEIPLEFSLEELSSVVNSLQKFLNIKRFSNPY